MTARRLWDKGGQLDRQMHAFTVGNDPELDLELIKYDAIASGAHAQMLTSLGVLTEKECGELLAGLKEIITLHGAGRFSIAEALEDGHTAIETYLADHAGEAGLKIHTGRSRNDQILVAMRLYLRASVLQQLRALSACTSVLLRRYDEIGPLPMPGYTHMQPAMPCTVGMWLHAFAEAFLEMIRDGLTLLDRINANPLGVASGFGSPLPLDRDLTARLLGFSRVQRNPIDVQNSRGRYELKVVRWNVDIAGIIEKLAWDLILFSTREFGFFSLPEKLTTGSSIMPQKKNPDVLELLRARTAKVRAAENELLWVTAKLPSSYHRDFQYTKEPVLRAVKNLEEMLSMTEVVLEAFSCNEDRLKNAMSDDLYATYDVYRRVAAGVPFREAYRATAERIKNGEIKAEELSADYDAIDAVNVKEAREARRELKEFEEVLGRWQNVLDEAQQQALR